MAAIMNKWPMSRLFGHCQSFSVVGDFCDDEKTLIGIAFHLNAADPILRQRGETIQSYARRVADELIARISKHQVWLREARAINCTIDGEQNHG